MANEKPAAPVKMKAPEGSLAPLHIGLPDGTTFSIPNNKVGILVPEKFQAAAKKAGAQPVDAPKAEAKSSVSAEVKTGEGAFKGTLEKDPKAT